MLLTPKLHAIGPGQAAKVNNHSVHMPNAPVIGVMNTALSTVSGCFLHLVIDHSPCEGTKKRIAPRMPRSLAISRIFTLSTYCNEKYSWRLTPWGFRPGNTKVGWQAGRYKMEDVQLNHCVRPSDGFGVRHSIDFTDSGRK
jgi:hypothetical protein